MFSDLKYGLLQRTRWGMELVPLDPLPSVLVNTPLIVSWNYVIFLFIVRKKRQRFMFSNPKGFSFLGGVTGSHFSTTTWALTSIARLLSNRTYGITNMVGRDGSVNCG